MPFESLKRELEEAAFSIPAGGNDDFRYCIFGSGVMYLYGLRDEIGDVDIFVSRPLWNSLRNRGWEVHTPRPEDPSFLEGHFERMPPVHAFYAWKKRGMQIDIEGLLNTDLVVEGWPVQSLESLRAWKASIMHHDTRPNDLDDIVRINEFIDAGGLRHETLDRV